MTKLKHIVYCGPNIKFSQAANSAGVKVTWIEDMRVTGEEIAQLDMPDLFLMHPLIKGGTAFELIPLIRQHHPKTSIWIVTAQEVNDSKIPEADKVVIWMHDAEPFLINLRLILESRDRSLEWD